MSKPDYERVEVAAERFMRELGPQFDRLQGNFSPGSMTDKAWQCVKGAFLLYDLEWDCHSHDICDWQWPAEELKRQNGFSDHQPWTILLRTAVKLMRNE